MSNRIDTSSAKNLIVGFAKFRNLRINWPTLARVFMIIVLPALSGACVSDDLSFAPQIEALSYELGHQHPTSPDEVIDFACLQSCHLNLDIDSLCDDIDDLLDVPGPWYRTVLFTYLLALAQEPEGLDLMIDLLEDRDLDPLAREGVIFSGLKLMGLTERSEPVSCEGWEVDLDEWEDHFDQIEEIGLDHWRLNYLHALIVSGAPDSGDRALRAAEWLSHTLDVSNVSSLAILLDQGDDKCDLALITILEHLLVRDFLPDEGEDILTMGKDAFWQWYVENIHIPSSDQWITEAFIERGFDITDLYQQTSISKISAGLYDDSDDWVRIRTQVLKALNRICGFYIDRGIIFKPEEVRMEAADACLQWYQQQAALLKVE